MKRCARSLLAPSVVLAVAVLAVAVVGEAPALASPQDLLTPSVAAYSYDQPVSTGGVLVVEAAPSWSSRLGIGARAAGSLLGGGTGLGGGGELLVRLSRHVSLETALEARSSLVGSASQRRDVPLTLGLRVHLGAPEWVVSPYLVAAGGLDFADADLGAMGHARATFLDGQLGGGLELRLGPHVALTADARADGHRHSDGLSLASTGAASAAALAESVDLDLHLGAAVYF